MQKIVFSLSKIFFWLRNMSILAKPRVMLLAVFTGIVGALVAPSTISIWQILGLFVLLIVGSSGAGILNMWGDAQRDMLMIRTRDRPLPRGTLPLIDALVAGLSLSICATLGLLFMFNMLSALWMFGSISMYVFYTLWLKMHTPQNIVIAGIAGALPPLIGWCAITGTMPTEILPWVMFLVIFLWTPFHFWALALNHTEQYRQANIPMLPVVKGQSVTRLYIFVYTILTVVASLLPMMTNEVGLIYIVTAVVLGIWIFKTAFLLVMDCRRPKEHAHRLFLQSLVYLFALYAGIALDYSVREYGFFLSYKLI